MSSTDTTDNRLIVIRMFQDRGVDNAETVITEALNRNTTLGDLRVIVKMWDAKKHVGPGLLVAMALKGEVEKLAPKPKRPTYSEDRLPLRFMSHDEWLERRGYPTECPGGMLMAVAALYPSVQIECDKCGFLVALPYRVLDESPAIQNAVLGG